MSKPRILIPLSHADSFSLHEHILATFCFILSSFEHKLCSLLFFAVFGNLAFNYSAHFPSALSLRSKSSLWAIIESTWPNGHESWIMALKNSSLATFCSQVLGIFATCFLKASWVRLSDLCTSVKKLLATVSGSQLRVKMMSLGGCWLGVNNSSSIAFLIRRWWIFKLAANTWLRSKLNAVISSFIGNVWFSPNFSKDWSSFTNRLWYLVEINKQSHHWSWHGSYMAHIHVYVLQYVPLCLLSHPGGVVCNVGYQPQVLTYCVDLWWVVTPWVSDK